MKKILCPVDFSKTSTKAIDYAVHIAQRAGGHLSLMHVIHIPVVDTSDTALVANELLDEQMHDAGEKLKALIQFVEEKHGANRGGGFTCNYILEEGLLTDLAERLCKVDGYDLIVMGTTGLSSPLEELFVGSNTEAVVEEVNCAVLSIPANAQFADIEKIIYASDYSAEDKYALNEVVGFGSLFGAPIDVVHVVKERTAASTTKANEFWQELNEDYHDVPMQFQEVVSKHRDEGLKNYYKEANGSVLAVVRKEKGFLQELFSKSLAERMTYQADVPLLVLHGRKS
ncbi:universal stress protein [Pontibacter silvestris]|uniref:Universal stress protein n=1 Tax=Pontibacter silvestris TaxID=2305183 RepID=A0ABW4X0A7_9BACT|nr:universal stress protein [Pontibacter silvestris]MCC9135446.1 universal stress protein [Pontibacter silvestris]